MPVTWSRASVSSAGAQTGKRGFREAWIREDFGLAEVFPSDDADLVASCDSNVAQHAVETRRRLARLTHQAESLEEPHLQRQPGRGGVNHALVADQQNAPALWTKKQQRLLEARVEAGQEEEVGAVLPIAVDGDSGRAGAGEGCVAAALVLRGIKGGRIGCGGFIRQRHVAQRDLGHCCFSLRPRVRSGSRRVDPIQKVT